MHWFCSLKAYGDLVIACNSLKKKSAPQHGLLVGSHLLPLLNAIDYSGPLRVVNVGKDVPAIFDVKKCGYRRALLSGVSLRRQIRRAVTPGRDTLIFDTLGARQRFLASTVDAETLAGGADNIYLDYARYLNIEDSIQGVPRGGHEAKHIFIFPDSRLTEKEMPDALIRRIVEANEDAGKRTTIVRVGKSTPCSAGCDGSTVWVDGFDALVAQIRSADAIVSADSLPAHVAEYFDLPVFVFTPKANDYWMPLSSYVNKNFDNFDSLARYKAWVTLA